MQPSNKILPQTLHPPLLLREVVSRDVCARVIRHFEIGTSRPRSYQGLVDYELRECTFVKLPSQWDHIFQKIALEQMQPYFQRDIDPCLRDPPMIYGYPIGVGFVPHHDLVTKIELQRGETNGQPVVGGDYTIVLFCSSPDDYDGGELYFPDQGWTYKPPAGSAVIYPATADYVHGVNPITRGIRHVVVGRFFERS